MTYQELSRDYGEEVASRMITILSLESKGKLIQDLLDFMGDKVLDEWAIAISKEALRESA